MTLGNTGQQMFHSELWFSLGMYGPDPYRDLWHTWKLSLFASSGSSWARVDNAR